MRDSPSTRRFRPPRLRLPSLPAPLSSRRLQLVLAVGIAAALAWGGYRGTWWYWDRLEEAADQLGTPRQMDRLFETKSGTVFCVITCDSGEATLTVWYRTSLPYDAACKAFRKEAGGRFGRISRAEPIIFEGEHLCPFVVSLPRIKSDASLHVWYLSGGFTTCLSNGSCNRQSLPRLPKLKGNEAIVTVTFNSGIE